MVEVLAILIHYPIRSEVWILIATEEGNYYKDFQDAQGQWWCQWHSFCYTAKEAQQLAQSYGGNMTKMTVVEL